MPPGERKGAKHSRIECAHILPFALSKLKEKTAVQVQNKATTWWALYEYFPALRGKIAADTVNQPGNAVTLSAVIHTEFALFTSGSNRRKRYVSTRFTAKTILGHAD